MAPPIVELGVHDNHQVGTNVDSPAEVARDDHHLHSSRREQLLDYFLLNVRETLVDVANTVAQCLNQCLKIKPIT